MISLASTAESTEFTTSDPATGELTDADSAPTATLRRNESASGVTVTITNLETGRYRASWTNGAWSAGDRLLLVVSATIGGTTYKETVWEGKIDALANSRLAPTTSGRTLNVTGDGYAEADAKSIDGSETAATNLKQSSLAVAVCTVVDDESNTATTFKIDTASLGSKADSYFGNSDGGLVLAFVSGTTNEYQTRRVVGFSTSSGFITVEEAFDSVPSDADAFVLLGRITELS